MIEHESDLIMDLLDVLLLYLHFNICHLLIHNFWMLKVLRQTEDTIVCTRIYILYCPRLFGKDKPNLVFTFAK